MKSLPLLLVLVLMTAIPPQSHAAPSPDDPALWLEDVTGKPALDWVGQQNTQSTQALATGPAFKTLDERFLTILNSNARIPFASKIGAYYYNFWRDAQHERGIWRRTTLAEYRKAEPAWETVLDLDALGASEKESWVWEGADPLPPDYHRCLVSLSRGGADATVVREFDLVTKQFVTDGFVLPESKSSTSWLDQDHLYIGVAFDSTTVTTSGYPRVVKVWTRGTPYTAAKTIYEGEASDVAAGAFHSFQPGYARDFLSRAITFYSSEMFLLEDGKPVKIAKPDDANAGVWKDWLLIELRGAWTLDGKTWPAGALLAAKLDDFMAGKHDLQMLFEPGERKSLTGYSTTKTALILNELDNVHNRLYVLRPGTPKWSRTPMTGLPEFGTVEASAVDNYDSDDYWLTVTDFLTPTSLALGTLGGGKAEPLKHTPEYFDGSKAVVTQHEAVSEDGTRIPYFEVAPKGMKLDGNAVTLMTGYGGFEVSEVPFYSGVLGSGWIERGGVLVVANIRGGGEFGPRWHEGGVKAQRIHCYEDFSAVARDLVARKVTRTAKLGAIGGSNGGLLMGNMLTQYPDLFGAIVCQAPLLDMQRYHKLLAGASWMGEYGDPDKPEEWAFIKTWSPYQLVRADAKYPPTLFTASTRDDRVHPGHARRMVYKLEALNAPVLYYENVEGGHGGAANNKQQAFMSALSYTFLWEKLAGGVPNAGH